MIITQRNSDSGRWHAIVSGRVTTDARFEETQFGARATFSICYENWLDDSRKWHNKYMYCRAAKELAALASYLEKGDTVIAAGVIRNTTFTDKRTGELKKYTELVCDSIMLPQSPPPVEEYQTYEGTTPFDTEDEDDGELPL